MVLLVLLGTVVALAGRSGPASDELEIGTLQVDRDLPAPPDRANATPSPQPPDREPIGEWKELPDAPLTRRSDAVAVWTGHEVVLWGGIEGEWHADGAAYDPAHDRWRQLPLAPIAPGPSTSAVWTGREMVAVGVGDGEAIAYDPDGDVWRQLPEPPLALHGRTAAVWNGQEVVVVGRRLADSDSEPGEGVPPTESSPPDAEDDDTTRDLDDGDDTADSDDSDGSDGSDDTTTEATGTDDIMAEDDAEDDDGSVPRSAAIAYDPSRDSWRQLPPSPLDEHGLLPSAVAVGERVALLGAAENEDGHPHLAISVYDPGDDAWADPDLSPFSTTTDTWLIGMDADDTRVGLAGSLLRGSSWRFQAAWWLPDEGWRRLPAPMPEGHADPFAAMSPAGLLVWPGTRAEAGWALADDGWQPLPEAPLPPRNGAAAVWTGQDLIVWGGRQGAHAHDDGMRWRARDRTLEYCCSP